MLSPSHSEVSKLHLHSELRLEGDGNSSDWRKDWQDRDHHAGRNCHQFRNFHSYTMKDSVQKHLGGRECPPVSFGLSLRLAMKMFARLDRELFSVGLTSLYHSLTLRGGVR
jgi:hypothetical protein